MPQSATPAVSVEARAPPSSGVAPPLHLTRFIGRGTEVRQVRELLDGCRLVTLTGAGGSGKTRLAAEVVSGLPARAGEERTWTELGPLKDPALVPQEVMAALGFCEPLGEAPARTLVDMIRDRPALLVLDNCEHLVQACAALVDELLRSCAALRILTTSRETLGVPGERPVVVPPLSLPTGATATSVLTSEAAQLFVERAQAILPAFQLTDSNAGAIAHICRRLDGLPLAIELAAARIRVLSVEQIAERLDRRFDLLTAGARATIPRHKTLRAAIEWSFDLLDERERRLLRRLSVFAGGFTLEAAEHVCGEGDDGQDEVLRTLTALVDKSLIAADVGSGRDARYRLLETLREFAREHLEASGDLTGVRRRHAGYYLRLVWVAEEPMFGGASDPAWVALLETEQANIRQVAHWCEERPERAADALRLATALHWFWFAKGRFREARTRLDGALGLDPAADPVVRARALTALGHVAIWQGDALAARRAFDDALPLLRPAGDSLWTSYTLAGAGAVATLTGRPQDVESVLDEAVVLARTVNAKVLLPFALYWRGLAAEGAGDAARARTAFQEAVRVAHERGHTPSIGHTEYALGRCARRDGDRAAALEHLAVSLAALHQTGDRWGIVNVVEELARAAASEGRPHRVALLLGAAEALRLDMGAAAPAAMQEERDRLMGTARDALGAAAFEQAWASGRALSIDELLALLDAEMHDEATVAATRPRQPDAPPRDELRVLALGPLQIERGGVLLGPEAWRSAKSRELLVFLLCHSYGCTRDQIGLAFWPEASPAQVRDNVHVTLHRLRRTLGGREWVVLADDRYRVADPGRCEFDVTAFERETRTGLQALRTQADTTPLESALARYRGDFLENQEPGDWHLEHRERLRLLYLNGLLALAGWRLERRQYAEAADAYRRLMARDALHEAACRGLMTCHAGLGERSAALRLYERLVEQLKAELGCAPDAATTALAERLRAGESALP